MSKTVKWILAAVALVIFIVVALFLYNSLSDKYADNGFDISDSHNESADVSNTTNAQTSRFPLAKDFTVLDEKGNKVKLSDFRGKPVVINFWASWCYYCKEEMGDFDTSYLEHSNEVVYLMINATDGVQETKQTADAYIKESGYFFDVYYDTTAGTNYVDTGATGTGEEAQRANVG